MAYLGSTGGMHAYLTATLEIMLDIASLHLQVKRIVTLSAFGLRLSSNYNKA